VVFGVICVWESVCVVDLSRNGWALQLRIIVAESHARVLGVGGSDVCWCLCRCPGLHRDGILSVSIGIRRRPGKSHAAHVYRRVQGVLSLVVSGLM